MPKPPDLSGRTFGDLLVIRSVGKDQNATRDNTLWLCQCARCGREEVIRQLLIPYTASKAKRRGARYACSVCMRGPCAVCGGEITSDTYKSVCSEDCYLARRREQDREVYRRKIDADPDYNKKSYKAKKHRESLSPEKAELAKQKEKARAHRRREQQGEQLNATARAYYHANKERILEQRKAQKSALSEAELAQKRANEIKYRQIYWDENAERILAQRQQKLDAMSSEEREIFLQQRRAANRASYRKKKAEKQLNDLMNIGSQLTDKLDGDK